MFRGLSPPVGGVSGVVEIVEAISAQRLPVVRELFNEYADSLGFDLCFQDFATELAELPGDYKPPDGTILMAMCDGQTAGCVAVRRFDQAACEMKRLYVRPAFRGQRVGRILATGSIEAARQMGYLQMLLDTVPWMKAAITLYESLGFEETRAYRHNPIEGARFMKLVL